MLQTGAIGDPAIAAAMLEVPRHRFVPQLSLDDAYADKAVAIKERDGFVISSISQPSMIAQMLSLLDLRTGDRVLEIGTGSGYNAALTAALAGPPGSVVTVDIEDDLLELARERFAQLGYRTIAVLRADDLPALAGPFERIIVTARCRDIDAQWWRLLADGGRIVAPLDIGYGGERAVGFVREEMRLRSIGSYACAFLELRGETEMASGTTFFRNRHERYRTVPSATAPLDIIAVRLRDATPALLEGADAVIARPNTLFAVRSEL